MNKIKTKAAAQSVKADLNHIKHTLQLAAREVSNNIKQRRADWQDQVVDKITDKPLKTVAIALFSGVVVGFIMRGKRNH